MPVETLEVGGKQYLYFYYYDPAKKRKKRVYCGPKGSPEAIQKVEQFQSRYEKAQDQKDRFAGVIGRLSALSGEIAGYSVEDRELILTCLMQAYPDLSWVESDQMALFGKVNGNKELERRLAPVYDDLKASLTRVHDVTGELRMLIEYIDSDWYYRVRYREPGDGDEKPERDPSWKYHVNDEPENMVVEILRGWLDAYDHAGRRLDVLEGFSRERKLHAVIEALALVGLRRVIADSRVVIREALNLL
ncbi:MAG: hypothetical protein ABSG45_04125 [Nitrososphaerales archaeon]